MNEQETTTDIIAWLRRPREGENGYLTAWRDEIADRLEAAHKYEAQNALDAGGFVEASRKNKQVGNAAKLREALSKSCAYFAVVLNAGMFNRIHLEALLNMAKAALAAPARNCDRFGGDNAKLQKVYYSECGKEYEPQDPNSRQAYLVGYGNWLLAWAKKGGAK